MFKLVIIILFNINFIIIHAQDSNPPGMDSVVTNEILVESNRIKMTNSLASNKIQVLDELFITSLNGGRLSDALEFCDAMFIKDYGFNSGIKTISLNSTQSEHTLVLIDGVRLNSLQNAQVDLSLFDLDNVLGIEISKGGSSALYGSEAIGGVININTKNLSLLKKFEINIKTNTGSYGLKKYFGSFSHNIKLNNNKTISYNLSGTDERAKNNFNYYYNNGFENQLKERENSDFNTQAFNLDIKFTQNEKTFLKLRTYYSHFERGVPGVELGYSAGTARQIDYNSISSLYFGKTINKKLNFNSGLSYKYSLQKYYDPATFNLTYKINSYYKLNSYSHLSTLNFTHSIELSLETGYEVSYNNIESNETEKGNMIQAAVFAAAKYEVNPAAAVSKVTFYPSLRYDYFSNINQKNVVTGKLGINIKPFGKIDFNIKSSIGNNFSAPTFNELYWKDLGNIDLKPERSISFDAGIYYRFKFFIDSEIELSYFNINTTDRIVWTPVSGSIWRPVNIGKVKSEGIDAGLKSIIIAGKNLNVLLNFSYSYGSAVKKNEDFPGDPSYNKQLIYLPKEMVKSSLMFYYLPTRSLIKYVSFSLFYRFTTRRYTNFENTVFTPRFDVLDGNAGFGILIFKTDVSAKFIVNNILNENYQSVPGYPMPLRNYKFEIGFKY